MGIIIAVAVIFAAVFFKLRYRPEGNNASAIFGVCLVAGIVMLLTVGTLSSWAGVLFYLAELVVCSLLVLCYRVEARRQAVARARRAAARRAAQEAEKEQVVLRVHERRPLSCFAAFTDTVGEAA